jgi:hypothetical protein
LKTLRRLALACLALLPASIASAEQGRYGAPPADLAQHLQRLKEVYPGTIAGFDDKVLKLADGTELPLSDGRTDKNFEELLNSPDIDDMFAFAYPAGATPAAPRRDFDPGRIRVEALFRALYGDCKGGTPKMRKVAWVKGSVQLATAQGADKALEKVVAELNALPASFTKFLVPSAGTYNCRAIANTSRMSMHAYGAAIDINTKHTTYWQWVKPDPDGAYEWSNKIPVEIVDIFERHGFIWGGRWYHFDTMHFEYRPELLGR